MKVLKVIHGYPPIYNAGSEVYSQLLCHGLSKKHEVHVFTREENPFVKDFALREAVDSLNPHIKLHIVNIPLEKYRYQYQQPAVDEIFANLLQKIKPDIVHIGHLNHLSTSLVNEVKKEAIPLIYTLHDYWPMCPRGQFIQRNPSQNDELWALCDGQEDRKCAMHCFAGYFSGADEEKNTDLNYWTDWVHRRMAHIRDMLKKVDCFIAPSQYLHQRYVAEFGLPKEKIFYLDYGFELSRLKNRNRILGEPFTFGYIGTHIPAKGIQHLILAFALLKGSCQLRIWGRPRAQNTEALRSLIASLPLDIQNTIHWLPEYRNEHIVEDVFNLTDCIVVPSIWVENSPLVIHESLQARVPVITANAGGMAEYIQHERNGLLFEHRNINSLAVQMQRFVDNPEEAQQLGSTGYLEAADANIPSLDLHIQVIEAIYRQFI